MHGDKGKINSHLISETRRLCTRTCIKVGTVFSKVARWACTEDYRSDKEARRMCIKDYLSSRETGRAGRV
jgi:hypothetical protein